MGNKIIPFEQDISSQMICPSKVVDLEKVGTVYFVQRMTSLDAIGSNTLKNRHFGLAVDFTGGVRQFFKYDLHVIFLSLEKGSSTTTKFEATHYDLFVSDSIDHHTYVNCRLKTASWGDYLTVREVGRLTLHHSYRFHSPVHYGEDIRYKLINHVHYALCDKNNGPHWSAILNCQTFTRDSIEFLGFDFPSDIEVVSDSMPEMVDVYLTACLTTADTNDSKKN